MKYSEDLLQKAHKAAFANRKQILRSNQAGCFYCLEIYPAKDVEEDEYIPDKTGKTAMCPRCGIDSVIGDASGYDITKDFLKDMNEVWFQRTVPWSEVENRYKKAQKKKKVKQIVC